MTMGTDPAATALAVVEMARRERFAEIEELFAPPLRAMAGAEAVRAAWTAETDRNGPVSTVGEPVSEPAGAGPVLVSVPVTCERGGLTVMMSVGRDGLLHGLRLTADTAPWQPPSYADPASFGEHDVTVGDGPLAVSGTVSLPHGPGPRPGVVLLGGGGPFDRDATAGANRPLKDLAWGLATRGVAVARFDKVTHTHGDQVAGIPGFTVTDEYVPHAVAAVRLLQRQPGVDPARVFVLGHSMGGRAAPRVAAAEASVAGLVIMAGDTQPMHRAAVRVVRHLASLDPGPAMEAAVEAFTRQAEAVADPGLSPSTPAETLLFGRSGAYWLDLRDDDPVATAAALDRPMFVLQGGRDYQVTVADDLPAWRAGLAHRPDVTIRVYDADDHLFFPGTGPSTPAGYEPAQHVDPAVVADVAEWLTSPGWLIVDRERIT
ncbi:alpha/beta hydrolase family protein [Streptosporangium sp. NPDC002721]|uniref:alpha/beta hydrolase family protein n=1 Tax=Streptosporangium sp. NPDC002721 TaxID=3366188 RepID=UPI0036827A83